MLSETQSMSVLVCVMLCYEPSPNTPPPQTHISHFGMMTLPVLASLTMILKLCSRFIVTFFPSPILLSFSFSYCLLSFTYSSSSPFSLMTPSHIPLLLLILYSNLPHFSLSSCTSYILFTPHTFHSHSHSMWGLWTPPPHPPTHPPRQCWVR